MRAKEEETWRQIPQCGHGGDEDEKEKDMRVVQTNGTGVDQPGAMSRRRQTEMIERGKKRGNGKPIQ